MRCRFSGYLDERAPTVIECCWFVFWGDQRVLRVLNTDNEGFSSLHSWFQQTNRGHVGVRSDVSAEGGAIILCRYANSCSTPLMECRRVLFVQSN